MIITLKAGAYYSNGAHDIRQIISIADDIYSTHHQITYRIFSAKKKLVWGGRSELLATGDTSTCLYSSFAAWAKHELSEPDAFRRAAHQFIKQNPLSPTEYNFLLNLINKYPQLRQDASFKLIRDVDDLRPFNMLKKKGLIRSVVHSTAFQFTDIGFAVLSTLNK